MDLKALTRKELVEATSAKWWNIEYLYKRNRLPIVRASMGKGYPTLFHPASIQIVKAHLTRNEVIVKS